MIMAVAVDIAGIKNRLKQAEGYSDRTPDSIMRAFGEYTKAGVALAGNYTNQRGKQGEWGMRSGVGAVYNQLAVQLKTGVAGLAKTAIGEAVDRYNQAAVKAEKNPTEAKRLLNEAGQYANAAREIADKFPLPQFAPIQGAADGMNKKIKDLKERWELV